MRVLLDTECAAIGGGHESACEQAVTSAAIIMGAGVGAIIGTGAGGAGAVPGAIVGGSAGALVAEVVGPIICANSEEEESNVEVGTASGNPFRSESVADSGVGGNSTFDSGAPLQLVVDSPDSGH